MRRSAHFHLLFGILLIGIGLVVVIGAMEIYFAYSGGGLRVITKGIITMLFISMFWIGSGVLCLRSPTKLNNLERVRDKLMVGVYGVAVALLTIGYIVIRAHPLIWFALMLLLSGSSIFLGVFEIQRGLSTDNI